MKRVRPILFALAAAMSALLCVGVCVLWVRSYRHEDHYGRSRVAIAAGTGGVSVERWGVFSSTGRVTFGGAAYSYTLAEYNTYVSPTPPAAEDRVGW